MASLHEAALKALDAGLGGKALKQNSSAMYYAAGSWPLCEPMKLFFQSKPSAQPGHQTAQLYDASPQQQSAAIHCLELNGSPLSAADPTLQRLLEAATPATLGREQRNELDPSCCSAFQLLPSAIALSPQLPPAEVLSDIQHLLQPKAHCIKAQLETVTIHGPGSCMESHISTPSCADMFGSLVVCLPSAFEGGQLLLRHKGASHSCNWSSQQQQQQQAAFASASTAVQDDMEAVKPEPLLRWATFFSDVEHEVLPVTSGYCITLNYNLLALPTAPAAGKGLLQTADIGGTTPLYGQLHQLLGNAAWHPMGGKLGFVLEHKYAAAIYSLKDSMFPGMLREADRLLYAAAAALGLKARVVPLYGTWGDTDFEEMMAWWEEDEEDQMSEEQYMMSSIMIGRSFDEDAAKANLKTVYDDDVAQFVSDIGAKSADKLGVNWCSAIDKDLFSYEDYVEGRFMGSCETYMHTLRSAAGLIITIPGWGSKARVAAIMADPAGSGSSSRGVMDGKRTGKGVGEKRKATAGGAGGSKHNKKT